MNKLSILVTGGAGFIGSHLCLRLLQLGHHVTILDSLTDFYSPDIKLANIQGLCQYPVNFIQTDILDERNLDNAFREARPDVVIHLAARAGIRPSVEQPSLYCQVNVTGTLNILERCRHERSHLIFASSSSVYGSSSSLPFKEDNLALSPLSPYAATKLASEALIHSYSVCYKLNATILRFFTVYGPRQRPDLAIYKFTKAICDEQPIVLYGSGESARDYTWISDIVDGIVASISRSFKSHYDVFNLGSSSSINLYTLVHLIEKSLSKKANIIHVPHVLGDMSTTSADTTKAQYFLNYHPKVSIEDGIEMFTDWFLRTQST